MNLGGNVKFMLTSVNSQRLSGVVKCVIGRELWGIVDCLFNSFYGIGEMDLRSVRKVFEGLQKK